MLSCKDATRMCSEALDRPLGLRERLTLRMHLMMCSGCTNYHEQMVWLRRISSTYAGGAFADPTAPDKSDTATKPPPPADKT